MVETSSTTEKHRPSPVTPLSSLGAWLKRKSTSKGRRQQVPCFQGRKPSVACLPPISDLLLRYSTTRSHIFQSSQQYEYSNMADPLSVAGSVVGLISLGIEVSDRLVQFYSSVQDSRQDVQSTRTAIEELRSILTSIQNAIEARRGRLSPDEVRLIESSALSCQGCMERLERKLNKIFRVGSGMEAGISPARSNGPHSQPMATSAKTPSPPSQSKPGWARAVRDAVRDSKGRLRYPFMESTLAKLRETIGEMKENLILSLQVLNL